MKMKSILNWESLGRILSVLSVVWISIQIFNYFATTKSGKIDATLKSANYILPQLIANNFKRDLPEDVLDTLKKIFSDKDIYNSGRASQFRAFLANKLNIASCNNFQIYSYFYKLNLYNSSGKSVESVNVDISESGFYQLISQDDSEKESFYSHNIIVGDLRPQNKATIYF